MILDFFATFFSGSMSLLPIFADRILGVGRRRLRLAARGARARGGWSRRPRSLVRSLPRRPGARLPLGGRGVRGGDVVFGLSRSFALTFARARAGRADGHDLDGRPPDRPRSSSTPDALRGRMTGVNMIFFMGGPQLGELEAGVVASLFASAALGATVAVVSGGVGTIAVAAFVAWRGAASVARLRRSSGRLSSARAVVDAP